MVIAAVTAALRDLLRRQIPRIALDLPDLLVTARSPDQARRNCSTAQLNLYLLDAPVDTALRNCQSTSSALGVSLHYLLTAYGRDDDEDGDLVCHRLLAAAMSVMHRTSSFDEADIGPLRISPMNMTALEMAALWSSFQTPYRLSAAYAVGAVTLHDA